MTTGLRLWRCGVLIRMLKQNHESAKLNQMRKKTKLVCGVGVNDADYPVYICAVIGGRQKNLWICPFYQAWVGMLNRCYSPRFQARRPTYIGCSMAPEWHSFSAFREWMNGQPWKDNQLDKDILIQGNKLYSPDTCVFVSSALNHFLLDRGLDRGEWPIGVSWDKQHGKFSAACSNPFTRKHKRLGLYDSPESAHEAWRSCKHQHACTYAEMQDDPRIKEALRVRYAHKAD